MNTKLISVGGAVLALLAVLLVGNMVVNTTPAGVAKTSYEYKVVDIGCEERDTYSTVMPCADKINEVSAEGYELYLMAPQNYHVGIFRKPR
jgi:hypothetical protein